jgi:hypothetical protein
VNNHTHLFTYHWLHIPSGEKGQRTLREPISGDEMLRWIGKWNAGNCDWKYWLPPATPYVQPRGPVPLAEEG